MTNAQKTALLLGVALFTLVAGYLGLSTLFNPVVYQGSLIDPPFSANDFTLRDQYENEYTLSKQTGKVVLIFFGYTSCPDVCPTTLADFKRIAELLGEKTSDVEFVMITADPDRDTPEKMGAYVNAFRPEFIGLSGTQAELDKVYSDYGVFVEKEESDSALNYLVSHTSRVYVVDQDGNLRLTFPYGLGARAMADDIANLLERR